MRTLSLILETLLWTGGCFFLPALCVKALCKATQKMFKRESTSGCGSLVIALMYAAMTFRVGFSVFDDMGFEPAIQFLRMAILLCFSKSMGVFVGSRGHFMPIYIFILQLPPYPSIL